MGDEIRKCIKCGAEVKSFSPMRKYCFDCRIAQRRVWADNTRLNRLR